MPHEWIAAPAAIRYLGAGPYYYNEAQLICQRAYAGVLVTKARLFAGNGVERRNQLVPKEFWWAEGQEALEQNWDTGDFSTEIDRKIVRAFGVSFDFNELADLLAAEKRGEAMQRISIAGNTDWISASALYQTVYQNNALAAASSIIVQACATGQLAARAIRATAEVRETFRDSAKPAWAAREWDVPMWFWQDYLKPAVLKPDWSSGAFRGNGRRDRLSETIELQGVHFHRGGLPAVGLASELTVDTKTTATSSGRPPKYDWGAATAAIWGKVYRGEMSPQSQADIERALQAHLARLGDEPSESTVRPFAKPMWEEMQRE